MHHFTKRAIRFCLIASSCFVTALSFAAQRSIPHEKLAINQVSPTGLSVMILGSGVPVADDTNGRASSGYLVFVNGQPRAMIDAGGGVFKSLSMSGANIWDLKYFLLTHMHIDHQSDVPAIVKTIYFDINRYNTDNHVNNIIRPYSDPIEFFGPGNWNYSAATAEGADKYLGNKQYLPAVPGNTGAQVQSYPSTTTFIHDLFNYNTGADRYMFAFVPFISIRSPYAATSPRSFFHVTAHDLDPTFWNPVPSQIQTVIEDPDGFTVRAIGTQHGPVPDMAYRVDYKGQSFIWTGDTTGLRGDVTLLAKTGIGGGTDPVDLLIMDDAILPHHPGNPNFAKLHPYPATIGKDAQAAGVTHLVLSHLSPSTLTYMHTEVIPQIRQAGYTGKIYVANDLQVYNLKKYTASQ